MPDWRRERQEAQFCFTAEETLEDTHAETRANKTPTQILLPDDLSGLP